MERGGGEFSNTSDEMCCYKKHCCDLCRTGWYVFVFAPCINDKHFIIQLKHNV